MVQAHGPEVVDKFHRNETGAKPAALGLEGCSELEDELLWLGNRSVHVLVSVARLWYAP